MIRQHSRIGHTGTSLGTVVLFAGALLSSGCGSDAGAASDGMEPSGPLVSQNHPPPPPPRPQTKEECDVCDGLWAVHGIEPVESCICRTNDGGQRCTDGRDCQGQCIVDVEKGFQIMDTSDPPRGYYTGTCSTYDTTFGCLYLIPPGISELIPLPAEEAVQHLCID